ncbi:MAG: 2-C-methyl-D-erythritol 4-phosphate cytidylyltransferase [Lactobacillales bacterium]|nr:2-C-methyl-D-erythritol 4-phosphate cytidylyltransferase [Lactobacillales bacterium]
MNYTLILLAAGSGRRMKASKNKVFLELDGISIIERTLSVFLADDECCRVLLVIKKSEKIEIQKLFADRIYSRVEFVIGGEERQDSVFKAVQELDIKDEYVMIHDGVRVFVTKAELDRLKQSVLNFSVALLGIPVKDTIKQVNSAGQVCATIPRNELWQAQTPQMFHVEILKKVHKKAQQARFLGTDDVSLVEKFFPEEKICMIMGNDENIKLTTPVDLLFGEVILKRRGDLL